MIFNEQNNTIKFKILNIIKEPYSYIDFKYIIKAKCINDNLVFSVNYISENLKDEKEIKMILMEGYKEVLAKRELQIGDII